MALPKISEARELDDQALETAIVDTKRKLFDLRFQKATRQLQSGLHQFKHERHRLAQLMTVLRERQLAEPQAEAEAAAPQAAAVGAAEEE
jgi:large subunit ribosomal protein L29